MYKTSVYTLVNGHMQCVTHGKQQKSLKMISLTITSPNCQRAVK